MTDLSSDARAILENAEFAAEQDIQRSQTNISEAYFADTLPITEDDYVGLEHLKYLTQNYELGRTAVANGFRALRDSGNAPDVIRRPKSGYRPAITEAVKDYISLSAHPWPEVGYRESVISGTSVDRGYYDSPLVNRAYPGSADYLLRAGFVVEATPDLVKRILAKQVPQIGKTAAAALCQVSVALTEHLLNAKTQQ